ncbi:MAG: deoxyribodipyrimidine photolyase [Polaromonas sp.]|nr:deoxyribodipyrimidine photolyase [Polaromonas sp.]
MQAFEPSRASALARLQGVNPSAYARSRNALDGAVTGLSPYLTHGMLELQEAARSIHDRQPLGFDDKLVFEFGWREFFHHVWNHAGDGGDAIFRDMHGHMPWHGSYTDTLPADIREGRTGVPVIDNSVRLLYATGYLHNHARMWLASYVVHIRKVHWRAGADWLYGHLLDGDLPSNYLSWQWVAGTFSSKPYLFNAENVLKYAPAAARQAWDSSATAIDHSYEQLDIIARKAADQGPERGQHPKVSEPELLKQFSKEFMPVAQEVLHVAAIKNIANQYLELVHPFCLAPRQAGSHRLRIGIVHLPFHSAWPWSENRWRFVLQAMQEVTDFIWMGDVGLLNLAGAASVRSQSTRCPGYREALATLAEADAALELIAPPKLFADPKMACRSFSKFYDRVRRDVGQFADLL